ncbi:hypothetical protein GE061_020156 [Apolygus lucorum]|uniref:Uncharacterized protein n=1 Tax=Apolygus lucorum TaxID=248454 RepID=A0A8S9WK89_APOLU|nr:hypothetical protein GE061_020156 [Apolygus lucorum]
MSFPNRILISFLAPEQGLVSVTVTVIRNLTTNVRKIQISSELAVVDQTWKKRLHPCCCDQLSQEVTPKPGGNQPRDHLPRTLRKKKKDSTNKT